jgi:hypothetical protein
MIRLAVTDFTRAACVEPGGIGIGIHSCRQRRLIFAGFRFAGIRLTPERPCSCVCQRRGELLAGDFPCSPAVEIKMRAECYTNMAGRRSGATNSAG